MHSIAFSSYFAANRIRNWLRRNRLIVAKVTPQFGLYYVQW